MAEQELATPEGGEGGTVAPEDVGTTVTLDTDPNPDPPEPNPVEALAQEMGWRPKAEFRGKEEDWKPADEFIRAGRDIQRSMASELKEVKSTVSNMARVSERLLAQELANQEARLLSQRREAIDAGDHEMVEQIDRSRDELRASAPVTSPANAPEVVAFKERNPWLDKDPLAADRAAQVCAIYANRGYSYADQLKAAEDVIRREYPHHFPQARETKVQPQVAEPSSRGPGRKPNGKSFSDMPKEAQDMAIHLENTRGIDRERYTKSWFEREGTRA